jgi:hypothetical protein
MLLQHLHDHRTPTVLERRLNQIQEEYKFLKQSSKQTNEKTLYEVAKSLKRQLGQVNNLPIVLSARGPGESDSEQVKQISILFSKLKSGDVKKQIKAAILLEKTIYNEMPHSLLSEVVSQVTSALRDIQHVASTTINESADPLVEKKRLRHLLHVYCYLSSLAQCRSEMSDGLTLLSDALLHMSAGTTRDESDMNNRIKELCYWTLANLALGPHDTELKTQFPVLNVAALCDSLLKEVNEGVATLPSDEGTEVVVSEPLVPAALRALAHLGARSSDLAGTVLGNTAFVQLLATLLGSSYEDTRQEAATLVRKSVQRLGGVTAVTRGGTQTLADLFPVLLSLLSSGQEAVVLDAAWTISLLLESDQLHGAFAEHSGVKKIFKVLTKLEQTMIYSQSDSLASTRSGSAVNIHNDVEAQNKRNNYYKSLQLSISWILLQLTTNTGFWSDKNGEMQANAIKALSSLVMHAVAPEVRLISARALHNLNTLNPKHRLVVVQALTSGASTDELMKIEAALSAHDPDKN